MFKLTSSQPESEPDEDLLPRYKDPGRILVEIYSVSSEHRPIYRYELEVLDYDSDSSVFWIQEGVGFAWWFDKYVDLDSPGFYVIEGITGTYYKGTWGFDDDDEEWEFTLCRRAADEEISMRGLGDEA